MSLQSRLAALISAIGADIKALKTQSATMVRVRRTTGPLAVPNTSVVAVSWDTLEISNPSSGMWSSAQNTRLYAVKSGPHVITAQVPWPANATGAREAIIAKNGNPIDRLGDEVEVPGNAVDSFRHRVTEIVWLEVGDYVELYLYQASGGSLDLNTGQLFHMSMTTIAGVKGDKGDQGVPGNVSALSASIDSTFTNDERIVWQRLSDGSSVAQIYVRTVDGPNKTAEVTHLATAAGTGHANQSFAAQAGGGEARLTVQNVPSLANQKRLVRASVTDDAGAGSIAKDFLRSDGSSDFVLAQKPGDTEQIGEAWRKIGSAGNPTFVNDWRHTRDWTNGNQEYVAFYKDPLGIVHLKGMANTPGGGGGAGSIILRLPVGYRPNRSLEMQTRTSLGSSELWIQGHMSDAVNPGAVIIAPAIAANGFVSLDGISFRAGDGTQA